MQGRPNLSHRDLSVGRRDRVVRVLDHGYVARVERERGLLAHHLLEIDLGSPVRVSRPERVY